MGWGSQQNHNRFGEDHGSGMHFWDLTKKQTRARRLMGDGFSQDLNVVVVVEGKARPEERCHERCMRREKEVGLRSCFQRRAEQVQAGSQHRGG